MKNNNILIIEEINFFTFVASLISSIFYKKIFIFKTYQLLDNQIDNNNFFYIILKKIYKNKIYTINKKVLENFTFWANLIGLKITNKINFCNNLEKILNNFTNHHLRTAVFKKYILTHVQQKCRLLLIMRYLNRKKYKIFFLESRRDYFNIYPKFKIKFKYIFLLRNLKIIFDIKQYLKGTFVVIVWLIRCIFIKKFHFNKEIKKFKIGYFLQQTTKIDQKIFIEELLKTKKTILFIKQPLKRSGIRFYDFILNRDVCDEFKQTINLQFFFRKILKLSFFVFLKFYKLSSYDYLFVCNFFVRYLNYEIFCQNYRINYIISRDDYDYFHGVKTIIQNNYGLSNIGIQHSSFISPNGNSYTCFDSYNYYLRHNELVNKFYKEYSHSDQNIIVGCLSSLKILKSSLDINSYYYFKKKYDGNINILICPPNLSGNNFIDYEHMFSKMKFIFLLLKKYNNINFFINLRKNDSKEMFYKIFSELKIFEERIIFDYKQNTENLIVNCDIVIASDTSTLALEVLYLQNKILAVLNYRFFNKKIIPWHNINKNFILNSSNEVFNFIDSAISNPSLTIKNQMKICIDDLNQKKVDLEKVLNVINGLN
jgi:hypothetical protein